MMECTPGIYVEQAWHAEIQRRNQELDSGLVLPISTEIVFAKAQAELKPP